MTTQELVCPECGFRKLVDADDDRRAAEYVLEHGRETGHKVRIESMPTEETPSSEKV